jgi:hypothetical protein
MSWDEERWNRDLARTVRPRTRVMGSEPPEIPARRPWSSADRSPVDDAIFVDISAAEGSSGPTQLRFDV